MIQIPWTPVDTAAGNAIWVDFYYKTSANYVADDVEMYVYRVGSNTLEALNTFQGSSFTNGLPAAPNGARYSGWVAPSSTDTSLRLMFHQASTNANAVDIYVDRLSIGPKAQVQTAIQSDWESYTPTWTNLTVGNATQTFKWRRVGDSMEISGHFLWGAQRPGLELSSLACQADTGGQHKSPVNLRTVWHGMASGFWCRRS